MPCPTRTQQHVWLRFLPQSSSEEAEYDCQPRLFLLDAIDGLADLDRSLDAEVRVGMGAWLGQRDQYAMVESRIFEILATHTEGVESSWVIRYLDFLASAPGYVNADEFRIRAALDGSRNTAEEAMMEWLEGVGHDESRALISSILVSVLHDTLAGSTAHDELRRTVRAHRRSELVLHVMQLLAPDIFWDDCGRLWSGQVYGCAKSALADYPYFEPGNIACLVQRDLVSDVEAVELAQLASFRNMIVSCESEKSYSNVAAEVRRILAPKLEPRGLFFTLLALREAILGLRRGDWPTSEPGNASSSLGG